SQSNELPHIISPEESFYKAKKIAPTLMKMNTSAIYAVRAYSAAPLLKDWWTGDLRQPDSDFYNNILLDAATSEPTESSRSAQLPRRPDIREATADEDKENKKDD